MSLKVKWRLTKWRFKWSRCNPPLVGLISNLPRAGLAVHISRCVVYYCVLFIILCVSLSLSLFLDVWWHLQCIWHLLFIYDFTYCFVFPLSINYDLSSVETTCVIRSWCRLEMLPSLGLFLMSHWVLTFFSWTQFTCLYVVC